MPRKRLAGDSLTGRPAAVWFSQLAKGTLVNLIKIRVAILLVFLALSTSRLSAGVLDGDGIGVYGDSLSWQYSLWVPLSGSFGYNVFSNGRQLNWVDHLVQSGYNFGPQVDATGNGNYYNRNVVAFGGNQSTDLPAQVSSLTPHLANGDVKLAVLEIGGNNFTTGVGNQYQVIYNKAANAAYNPLNDVAVHTFIDSLLNDITTAVDATLAANPNVHMILTTVPDLGDTPQYRAQYTNASRRADVTAVVNEVNQQILALAAQHNFPVVDLQAMGQLAVSPPALAGVTLLAGGSPSGASLYLSDKFHPGTVANGWLANAYLLAAHLAYGDAIAPISDQTILTRAGLSPTVAGPTYFDVSPFVIYTPVPEPGTAALAVIGSVALVAIARRSRRLAK